MTPINNSLGGKQDKTDNTLTTTDKTISGAINEINTKVGNLTGALTWKGKFDTLPAVTDYEAGNVVGVGNKEYVLTVTGSTKAWEELGDEGSYLLKSVAEETYLKKAAGEVATANIADDAVTKEKLANASVTYEKVSNDVQTKLDNNVKIVDQVLTAAEQKQVRKNIAIPNYETFDSARQLTSDIGKYVKYSGESDTIIDTEDDVLNINSNILEIDFCGATLETQYGIKGHARCKIKNLTIKMLSGEHTYRTAIEGFGYVENVYVTTEKDGTHKIISGFKNCDHLFNCKVDGITENGVDGAVTGFYYCNYLFQCRYNGWPAAWMCSGFDYCKFISQCYMKYGYERPNFKYSLGDNRYVESLIGISYNGEIPVYETFADTDHIRIGDYNMDNFIKLLSSDGGTGKTKLYAKPDDKSGMATVLLDTTPVNWAVARRTPKGTLKAKDATEDDDLVTKKQLDAAEKTYAKKTDIPTIPAIPTVNDPKVSIKMNGAEKGSFTLNQASAGEVDLGTVITAHQDISGKVDKTLNAKAFEGITIKTSNTTTDKAANVTAIQAYVDNLKALGVDTTKGYTIPVSLSSTLIGIMVGSANTPCHAGFYRQSNSIGAGTSGVFLIKNDGEFQNISLLTAGSDYQTLDTNHKNITGAINEVNKAVSDVNAAVKNIATIAEIDNLFVINTGSI